MNSAPDPEQAANALLMLKGGVPESGLSLAVCCHEDARVSMTVRKPRKH